MPKVVDHAAYRAELLDGSLAAFAEHGYAALSMRKLAAHLGVSTGTLYHYFATKEEIFGQMLAHAAQRSVVDGLAALADAQPGAPKVEALFAFVERNEDYFRQVLLVSIDYHRHTGGTDAELLAGTLDYYREAIRRNAGIEDAALLSLATSAILGAVLERMIAPGSVAWPDLGRLVASLA